MLKQKGCALNNCSCTYDNSYNYITWTPYTLITIDCSSKNIRNLDSQFNILNESVVINTTNFSLSRNDFYTINSEMFKKFPSLELLNLSFNKINQIEVDSFSKLFKIKVLNLDYNNLTSLNSMMFDGGITN